MLYKKRRWALSLRGVEGSVGRRTTYDNGTTNRYSLDYDSQRLQLVIRMPSLIHEHLLAVIEGEIISQLITIRTSNGPAALLAGQIESYRSSTIYLEDESRRDPDSQFIHEAAKYPGVVIEVAYTQSGKNLSKLADHYIVESSGKISMVIGLSVDYQGSKKATISIWYPMYGVDEDGVFLASEEILSEVGGINIQTSIELTSEGVSKRGW